MDYNVTVIPGDGIGPEIVREARKVLDQVGRVYGHSFDYTEILMGDAPLTPMGFRLQRKPWRQPERAMRCFWGPWAEMWETHGGMMWLPISGRKRDFWLSARDWGSLLTSGRLIFIRNWLRHAL